MEFRHLGKSGLKVSEIAYGNWLTHGSQVEEDAARACVAAALDEGITTFDTADVYAGTKAEEVLGRALHGIRRESLEIFTKVYWPTGSGVNDRGLSRKHIMESAHASLRRLRTDYVDLYQAHRYDHETPLEETMRAFDDLVRQGKALYIGVSEWRSEEIAAALRIAGQMGLDRIVSNQPQYNMIWRVIESEVVPLCEREGIGQLVWSPIAQGALTGKYQPGAEPPAGSRATDARGSTFIREYLTDDILQPGAATTSGRRRRRADAVPAGGGLDAAESERLAPPSSAPPGPSRSGRTSGRAGVRLDAELLRRIDEILGPVIVRDPAVTGARPPVAVARGAGEPPGLSRPQGAGSSGRTHACRLPAG